MWPMVAAAAASLVAGKMGSDAAEDAAKEQSDAIRGAAATQTAQQQLNRYDLAPFREAGSNAIGRLSELMGLGNPNIRKDLRYSKLRDEIFERYNDEHIKQYGIPLDASPDLANLARVHEKIEAQTMAQFESQYPEVVKSTSPDAGLLTRKFTLEDFENDPVMKKSFEFGKSEGEKAVQRMFGARGMSRSGAAVKAATRFAEDYAGSKAAESRARFIEDQGNLYNRLAGISGSGQTAVNTTATLGANTANSIGDMIVGGGNARGAATVARTNAMGGALSGIGNSLLGQYNLDRIMTNGGINPSREFSMPTSNFYYTGSTAAGGNQYG